MSSQDDSAALSEMRELVSFVTHANPAVRHGACKMVTSLSALEANRALIAQTQLVPALAKQMTAEKDVAREVYKSLVNFAESEPLYVQMLQANTIAIAMECLRDPHTDLEMRELILMFLVNMSRDEKGARLLLSEGEEIEGLHVRRLVNWFVQPVPAGGANKSQLDPNAYCAHILTNISQLPSGRRLLMNRDRGFMALLKPQLTSSNETRRIGTFNLIKNCFMDEENQLYLLSSELGLWPLVLAPIIGNEPFLHGESEYEGILPEVRRMMTREKRRDPDPQLRVIVYEIILLCARYKPARVLLKSQAMYPILRHAHDSEKEHGERELDDLLEQLVPFFILDEDSAEHPEAREREERRRRVEQVKEMNEREEAGAAAAAASAATKRPAAEAVDQPVHYLGDELGGAVRAREAATARKAPSEEKERTQEAAPATAATQQPEQDDSFPAMEPIGAEETEKLGEVTHNIKSLSVAQAESAKAAAPAAPAKEIVYAQPEADEDDDDVPELRDEDEREENYMNALD